jgi:hypothetical protein
MVIAEAGLIGIRLHHFIRTSEQDIEIRKRLKVQKPGEASFIIPEASRSHR